MTTTRVKAGTTASIARSRRVRPSSSAVASCSRPASEITPSTDRAVVGDDSGTGTTTRNSRADGQGEPTHAAGKVHKRNGPGRGGAISVSSGGEDLVEDRLRLVFVGVLSEGKLRHEDLAGLGEHPLLAGREAALALAAPEVAHDLGHLHHIAGVQLLEVGLVATRPVGRLLGVLCAKHLEDALEPGLIDDVANADEIEVARRNAHHEIVLGDDAEDEIQLVLTFDLTGLNILDDSGSVIGIHHRLADRESHVSVTPFEVPRIPRDSTASRSVVPGQSRNRRLTKRSTRAGGKSPPTPRGRF